MKSLDLTYREYNTLRQVLAAVRTAEPLQISSEDPAKQTNFLSQAAGPDECAGVGQLGLAVRDVLLCFSNRNRQIIEWRYGLDDRTPETLEEVGSRFGLTRERIRQLEAKTIKKLQHPLNARRLEGYLPGGI